jgi:hypothetical protein
MAYLTFGGELRCRFSNAVNKAGRGWMDSRQRRRAANYLSARSIMHRTVGRIDLRPGEVQGEPYSGVSKQDSRKGLWLLLTPLSLFMLRRV